MAVINANQKTRKVAFTTENRKVEQVNFFIDPVHKHSEEFILLRKELDRENALSLEVSSFSDTELGRKLSAFQMQYKGKCLECVFQSSKVFEYGGPYIEWLDMPPRQVLKDPRKHSSGKVLRYELEDETWTKDPLTGFYDNLYLKALFANPDLLKELQQKIHLYKYFTDVALNPNVSTNCQARSVALLQLMYKENKKLSDFSNKEDFIKYHKQSVIY